MPIPRVVGRDTVRGPELRARSVTADLLDLAYEAQDVVGRLREIHDPRVAPKTYVYALLEALREHAAGSQARSN